MCVCAWVRAGVCVCVCMCVQIHAADIHTARPYQILHSHCNLLAELEEDGDLFPPELGTPRAIRPSHQFNILDLGGGTEGGRRRREGEGRGRRRREGGGKGEGMKRGRGMGEEGRGEERRRRKEEDKNKRGRIGRRLSGE